VTIVTVFGVMKDNSSTGQHVVAEKKKRKLCRQ